MSHVYEAADLLAALDAYPCRPRRGGQRAKSNRLPVDQIIHHAARRVLGFRVLGQPAAYQFSEDARRLRLKRDALLKPPCSSAAATVGHQFTSYSSVD